MNEKLPDEINNELETLKEYMVGTIFDKLEEVENLKGVNSKYSQDYKVSPDYHKISQIVEQYQAKYSKDLV